MRFTSTKNVCEIKKFRPLGLQPVELCYILLVFCAEWKTVDPLLKDRGDKHYVII